MKKKLVSVLLAVLTALCVIVPSMAFAEADAWIKLNYADGSLNVRSGPGKNYNSVGYVKHGDAVDIYFGDNQTDFEGEEWAHIKVQRTGTIGYVKTKYLSSDPVSGGSSGSTGTSATVYVSANGGSLKLRKGPGTDYGVAGYLEHGDKITVQSTGSVWSKVKVNATGKVGYIKNKYIATGSNTTPSTTPSTSSGYQCGKITTKTTAGAVNVRKGAGTSYASVGTVGRGTLLKITAQDGNWYKVVTATGLTGYVSKSYVSTGITARTTANLNMRKGAGSSYARVTTLSKGAAVTVYSVSGNWAYVKSGSSSGYVSINYLTLA